MIKELGIATACTKAVNPLPQIFLDNPTTATKQYPVGDPQ